MRFAFTDEQQLFRHSLRELLEAHCSAAQLRRVFEGEPAIAGLWARLCEHGMIGALAPAAAGGSGLCEVDLALLLEETGRVALPEPVVETAAVAVPLLGALSRDARAATWLSRIVRGEVRVALGIGPQCSASAYIAGADRAQLLLVSHAGELHGVAADRAQLASELRSVDRTRKLARVRFEPSADTLLARGELARRLSDEACQRAALGVAAQLVGLGARMLELTTAYVQTREQFGRPIGSFQAVKHQLVDAHLAIEFARPLVYRAAYSLATADPARSVHVSMAKAYASEAALLAAGKALQLHGAIGYSYEYELQLFMKRAWALAAAYGDATEHRKRIADAMFEPKSDAEV